MAKFDKDVRPAALCSVGGAEIRQFEEIEETETGCQKKQETRLKVKGSWRRQTGV